jgi:hypothetical protein
VLTAPATPFLSSPPFLSSSPFLRSSRSDSPASVQFDQCLQPPGHLMSTVFPTFSTSLRSDSPSAYFDQCFQPPLYSQSSSPASFLSGSTPDLDPASMPFCTPSPLLIPLSAPTTIVSPMPVAPAPYTIEEYARVNPNDYKILCLVVQVARFHEVLATYTFITLITATRFHIYSMSRPRSSNCPPSRKGPSASVSLFLFFYLSV